MSVRSSRPAADGLLPRPLAVLAGSAAAVVTLAGVHAARGILGPLFLALVLTIVVHPLRVRLARRLPAWLATTVCIALSYLIVLGLAISVGLAIARFATLVPTYAADADALVTDLTSWLDEVGVDSATVRRIVSSFDLGRLADAVASVLSGVAELTSGLVLVLALCFFLGLDAGAFPDRMRETAVSRPRLVEALAGFASGTRRYLLVSTVFGLVVAVLDTIALWLLGVPAPLLWGLLAFLTNYIPNIGFVIGLAPPAVLALLDSGVGLMVAVIVVYCLLNLVIQSGIQPRIVGAAVGLSTTLTFVSLVFWSWIIGPVGTVLAVPLSLLARALLVDAHPGSRWLAPLITNRPEEEGDA